MDPFRAAQFCLYREYVRRPKRQNSLETLGLVQLQYPAIQEVEQAPSGWSLGLEEWRAFLHICVDFFARANSAVVINREFLRWMGTRILPRKLVPPDEPREGQAIPWPQVRGVGRPPNLARLLLAALGYSAEDKDQREEVNGYLWDAWRRLQAIGLLRREEEGFRLNLEEATLVAPRQVYRCPVTYTAVGVTLRGLTPYLSTEKLKGKQSIESARCTQVEFPRHPEPFAKDKRQLLEWLESDPTIRAAREQGLWRELSDRIAVGSDYFQVGEHSAQQPSSRLKELEAQFKDGYLNILSCSTTMEMGVDIGGVSAVSMNNAPPGPANFLQRAGRAGRRGETASVSLTLCKAMPHGEEVFHNPLWPFTTPVAVPNVSLQSERLVLRHINALALNYFLRDRQADSIELKAGGFFGAGDGAVTPADQFMSWLRAERRSNDAALQDGASLLCARSCLAGQELPELLRRVAESFAEVQQRWLIERWALRDEMQQWGSGKAELTPAQLALSRQIERQEGEYLLAMLSSARFLPGHGFPTGVVPFIHTNLEQLRREEKERKERKQRDAQWREREDNRFRRRGYPSRDVAMAIREYAPGNSVVLDGQVYRSEGVTLNWHIPASDKGGPSETQSFRHAWRCSYCGASGDRAMSMHECPSCHRGKPDLRSREYLEPAGFAVNIYYKPTNDLSSREYVPVRPPWISAGGVPFLQLPRPEIGRYRHNPSGHIFVHSGGERGLGYAICLRCGRAVSECEWADDGAERPKELRQHLRLRGGKNADGETICTGNDSSYAVKRNQLLGASAETDIFELQLRDPRTGGHLSDRSTAVSLAVSLRQALAEELGIEDREIGFTAIPALYDTDERGFSVILYDTASGGAGYVGHVAPCVEKLLRRVRDILSCSHRDCDRACHGCLLSYDTQFYMQHLDRKKALAFLSEDLIAGLGLPLELRHFGPESELEFEPLLAALRRELQRPDAKELRFYVGGDPEVWDPTYWPVRRELLRHAAERAGRLKRTVVAPQRILEALEDEVARALASLLEGTGTELHAIEGANADWVVPTLIAEVVEAGRTVRWSVGEPAWLVLGEDWAGGEQQRRCVRGVANRVVPTPGVKWELSRLRRPLPGTYREVTVAASVIWPIAQAAPELWRRLLSAAPQVESRLKGDTPLQEVRYQDRYLGTPLLARLLTDLMAWLRERPGGVKPSTRIHVMTAELGEPRRFFSLNDDWEQNSNRKAVISELFQVAGLTFDPTRDFDTKKRRDMPHARQLTLRWADGVVWTVRLDHGLGFLRALPDSAHPFGKSAQEQARHLLQQSPKLEVRDRLPVYFYVGALE